MLRCYMVTCAIGWLFCRTFITVLFCGLGLNFIEMSLLSSSVDHQNLGSGKANFGHSFCNCQTHVNYFYSILDGIDIDYVGPFLHCF
jgi:hypothetical protein